VQGDQLGRTIGFRTANIDTQSMLPRDGVYAAIVTLPNGTRVGGAVNVGSRPTVQGTHRRAEVHLIDQGGSPASLPADLDEYGWRIRVWLIGWVRDQVKFDSLDVLQGQLGRDVKRIAATIEPMLHSPSGATG
jgi:riboflavin kinase/FMN adenylyltransferase